MKTSFKVLCYVGLALGLGAVIVGGALRYVLRRSLPKTKGKLTLDGLHAEVEVVRDRWGVPHIYGQDAHDLYFALGFVHAQDRLWQMEFRRRLASGTLAEVLGKPALTADRLMRRMGLRRTAEQQLRELDADTRVNLEAYTAGVNSYLERKRARLPVEFRLLRLRPQPWTLVDVVTLAKWQGWILSSNWDTEIVRSRIIDRLGAEAAADLEPLYPEGAPLAVPPGAGYHPSDGDLLKEYEAMARLAPRGGGSNNWVVDGAKSSTGKPLLANDPHLPPEMPGIWYEVHLSGGGLDVVGASLAGLPAVVIGHNRRIAWGVTASTVDQQDLYVIHVNPENSRQYRYQGRWRDGDVAYEPIWVRGRSEPVMEEVLVTHHGPVISPAIDGESRALAVRSVPLESLALIRAGQRLVAAENWDGFREALHEWSAPGLNFVYADVDGNIGYQLAGFVPVRRKGRGMVPAPGWDKDYEWNGYVPFEELPHSHNPEAHFVATANNRIDQGNGRYPIYGEWLDGYRVRRIVEMLRAKDKLSLDDFRTMHADCFSLAGREVAQHLARLQPEDEKSRRALEYIRDWDYRLSADSVAAALYSVFFYHMYRNTFAQKLGDALDSYTGQGVHLLAPASGYGYRVASHLAKLMEEAPPDWFSGHDGQRDTWQTVMLRSLEEAIQYLEARLGKDMSRWQWGRLHRVTFSHPLGQVRPLRRLFNRGPIPADGDMNTVVHASYDPASPYDASLAVVSYRQIIDLGDFRNSLSMHTTGQSGQPGSRHYDDMIGPWRSVEYHPMLFERPDVLEAAESTLILRPEGQE